MSDSLPEDRIKGEDAHSKLITQAAGISARRAPTDRSRGKNVKKMHRASDQMTIKTYCTFVHPCFFFCFPLFLISVCYKKKAHCLNCPSFECVLLLRGGGHDHPLKNAQLIRQIIRQITDWVIGQMSAEGERMGTDETFAEKEFGRLTDKWRRQWRSTFMFKIKL